MIDYGWLFWIFLYFPNSIESLFRIFFLFGINLLTSSMSILSDKLSITVSNGLVLRELFVWITEFLLEIDGFSLKILELSQFNKLSGFVTTDNADGMTLLVVCWLGRRELVELMGSTGSMISTWLLLSLLCNWLCAKLVFNSSKFGRGPWFKLIVD